MGAGLHDTDGCDKLDPTTERASAGVSLAESLEGLAGLFLLLEVACPISSSRLPWGLPPDRGVVLAGGGAGRQLAEKRLPLGAVLGRREVVDRLIPGPSVWLSK